MSKNLIVKDNALINASYNLELVEQRLVLLAIAQARNTKQEINSDTRFEIHVSDYVDVYNIKGRSVYENIKSACNTLFERQFSYTEQQKKGVRIAKSRWVSEIAYNDEIATIDLTFSPAIIPLVTMLEKHFTSYELEQVADLKSKYAVRLYEVIISWRVKGKTPMISVEDIRSRLGLTTEYKTISELKKWVLDLGLKEINEKTDIKASYEQHKRGRKIIGFTFSFKQKQKINKIEEERDEDTVDMFAPLSMTDKQRSFFAGKLSELHECSTLPYGNQSYDALAKWIAQDLLKPERAEFYRPLLKKVGFSEV